VKLKLSTFVLLLLCLAQVAPAFAQDTNETRDIALEKSEPEPSGAAQSSAGAPGGQSAPKKFVPGQFTQDLLKDQKQLWTAPFRLHFSDTAWLVPLSGITAGLLVTDTDVSKNMSRDPKKLSKYTTLSNAGIAALVGSAGAMWLFSHHNSNEHWRETGLLSGEAALQSMMMTEALKYSFGRERPTQGTGNGRFFQGGQSFPSQHSAAAWSIASVIAHEYPGPLPTFLAYSTAAMVSYSRVHGRSHFPSDVLIGALIGELTAHQVYSRHHDPEISPAWVSWTSKVRQSLAEPSIGNLGSPYVPLDSWVYAAFDRLAAQRLIDSEFAGMRPWTRRECARLVREAGERIGDTGGDSNSLYRELAKEFSPELDQASGPRATLESVYTRVLNISGPTLTNGYYFGQTNINDFGRPYAEGWNTATGLSFYLTSGPWVGYFRGEMQTAPSDPALPLAARQFISDVDHLPGIAPGTPTPAVQQLRLLDAYVGLTFSNWELSFGPQSLSWGPGAGGALLFSDNAPPINMFRVNRVAPLTIPLVSRFLGPMRLEFFFGQLTGHHFVGEPNSSAEGSYGQELRSQPYIHGQRFSFKPTRNFEFGFSRTTIMGGPGVPLTLGTFKNSLFGLGNGLPGSASDPGDRRSGMDWSYRLPKLRDWLTFYGDAFTDDEFSPIAYWDRSAFRAGLYLSHFPRVPKLDLRVEGVYTDLPVGGPIGHGFFYSNTRFRDGYTNEGSLMGNWIGRDGQGAQAWANYWLGARNRLQFSFRHQKVSQQFDPGGGTITDFGARADIWTSRQWEISTGVQYEAWTYPVLRPGPQKNFSTSVQVTLWPKSWTRHSTSY
jgi:hypothetical protein